MIPQNVSEKVRNQSLDSTDKGMALLDCIESRLEDKPSDFTKLVDILESEPYLAEQAKKLVEDYCE